MTDLPDPTPPAPDLIDPIVGCRQWRLARNTLAHQHGMPLDSSLRPPRVREPVIKPLRWSIVS
ncbi:MAG: hypothetical protein ACJ780_15955 [Solirubrobacteraceae bacterium]